MIRRPPRSTLFPYTTLFRSHLPQPLVALHRDAAPAVTIAEARGERLALLLIIGVVLFLSFRHPIDRKSTRLNSSHANISYAVFCLKKKKNKSRCRTDQSRPD